ncbi:hypothetical protein [Barnesiella intestinihominis]|jgi:hypothetical protein|uniref:hypothetical protein n=1 Tax=Barnesiella intestinihominis TaxID=487174 RepID=UPI00396779BF
MIFADKAIRFLLANKNPTTFAPALSRNITGSCRTIKRRWHEETEGLEKMKYLAFNLSPCRVPWHYGGVSGRKYRGSARRARGLKRKDLIFNEQRERRLNSSRSPHKNARP